MLFTYVYFFFQLISNNDICIYLTLFPLESFILRTKLFHLFYSKIKFINSAREYSIVVLLPF